MSSSWINYLNVVPGSAESSPPNGIADQPIVGQPIDAKLLTDELLREQLEQWTTVSFGAVGSGPANVSDDGKPLNVDSPSTSDFMRLLESHALNTGDKHDPSPYAKRPFGTLSGIPSLQPSSNFGSTSLERGFNAFSSAFASDNSLAPSTAATQNDISTALTDGVHNFESYGIDFGYLNNFLGSTAPDGSNALFASPLLAHADSATVTPSLEKRSLESSTSLSPESLPGPTKRSRKNAAAKLDGSAPASASSTPGSTDAGLASSTSLALSANDANLRLPGKVPLLTKAAILAAQAAELKAQAQLNLSAEEEAARKAELERIAVEDDKRRRNTAASARFRVKKKQREAALEGQISELHVKIERLEKELEATRVENGFLRDLVIRKVGLRGVSPSSGSTTFATEPAKDAVASTPSTNGKMSGGQEGATGMGTQPGF